MKWLEEAKFNERLYANYQIEQEQLAGGGCVVYAESLDEFFRKKLGIGFIS